MSVLEQMATIGLEDMKAVRLMNRVDQKHMACVDQLEPLLEMIADGYFVQFGVQSSGFGVEAAAPGQLRTPSSELRAMPYRTLYFDTPGLAMYTMHHNQKLNRQKIRVRTYRSTNTTFFEIKNKDNKKKTRKVRIPIDVAMFDSPADIPEVVSFVEKNTAYTFAPSLPQSLTPCLENRFSRITLVDKALTERITIDSGITFHNRATGIDADISRLMVIEVKHQVGAPMSAVERALHQMHIQPRRMSKYCIGTAITTPNVKHNRFKEKLLYIEKLTKDCCYKTH